MTENNYVILGMVVAGLATNFLGAAFTIKRLRAHSSQAGREVGHKWPFGGIGVPWFSAIIEALSAIIEAVIGSRRAYAEALLEIRGAFSVVVCAVRVVRQKISFWAKHD
jgi:hypothetical protein